jgi:hypothetical protein
MTERDEIAWKLAEGIAGYFQFVNASQLLAVPGEDSAQFVMCQILQSLQRYRIQVSTAPTDTLPDGKPVWKGSRIDAGLLAKADDASTWYGAVEVKWITSSYEAQNVRPLLLKDCARLASVNTNGMRAQLLVVGFIDDMLNQTFDVAHPRGGNPDLQRTTLGSLLSRTIGATQGLTHAQIVAAFPDYQESVPASLQWTDRGLNASLLASAAIAGNGANVGSVLVWQINKRPGPAV